MDLNGGPFIGPADSLLSVACTGTLPGVRVGASGCGPAYSDYDYQRDKLAPFLTNAWLAMAAMASFAIELGTSAMALEAGRDHCCRFYRRYSR